MKSKKMLLGLSSIITPIVTSFFIVSCSNKNPLQDEANQIYLNVYNSFKQNNYAKPTSNVFNVYDEESLINNLNNNPISEIDRSKFDFRISKIDYSNATSGELTFKFDVVDKSTNNVITPTINSVENYFSQIISVKGFEQLSQEIVDDFYKVYEEQIVAFEPTLNTQGQQWISNNFDNLDENISFDKNDQTKNNYFLNFVNKPTINSKYFKLSNVIITNELNKKPIVKIGVDQVQFNFWFTLERVDSSNPMMINITNSNLKTLVFTKL